MKSFIVPGVRRVGLADCSLANGAQRADALTVRCLREEPEAPEQMGSSADNRFSEEKMVRLRDAVNVEDIRRIARRRVPRIVFDFIDGAADDEVTKRANRSAFDRITFEPQTLVDVAQRQYRTEVCGQTLDLPVLLAPTGLTRLAHHGGEIAAARAAVRKGSVFVLSSASTYSIEEVAAAVPARSLWFQLYPWKDRELTQQLIRRARQAGFGALCVTVDCPTAGNRERDTRNGLTVPPRPSAKNAWGLMAHPRWTYRLLRERPITFANLETSDLVGQRGVLSLAEYWNTELVNSSHSWDDFEWIREEWPGPLLVKGVMSAHDAKRAVDVGVDGIIVSNHGGRQLDGLPATMDVLPEILQVVGDGVDVLVDGGVRRGSDVVKAMALGAKACLIGRPYCFGLAAGGQEGVERVLDILVSELDRTLALLGCAKVEDLDQGFLTGGSVSTRVPEELSPAMSVRRQRTPD